MFPKIKCPNKNIRNTNCSRRSIRHKTNKFYNIVNKHSDLDVGICKDIDIANILLFLASDESRVITGQAIDCDCGCYL